ncbi:FAD binding domain-containing protein [Paraclostridium bifermentans]|jgi:CO/xanthine dehydrogenase FAD-binding subunit|uniref:FAD binding domain-containing protein n=1 Tax=Paraclostridium bifermentans TaxID=1490 RepID=UPI0018977569|nr:FAD binding domain-containing protein [Paraclostridium bifermentans]MBU5286816.1 FAD binding domain-containing protein [Paraclostridium bifermentans]
MFTLTDIVQPNTLEEAYSILTKRKNNQILGGTAFLRMGKKRIGTGIELSNLNLDYIKEDDNFIEIGAMTTLRSLETSDIIKNNFKILTDSVRDIIGVQFRNVVTVGGSVFSKYGFSDLIVALLCLDTEVETFKCGRISLDEFLNKNYGKDILTKIYINKNNKNAVYKSMRNAKSDYPILNVSVSKLENEFKICIGARPQRAKVAIEASQFLSSNQLNDENIEKAINLIKNDIKFGTNMRASKEYREQISKVLVKRAIMEVTKC